MCYDGDEEIERCFYRDNYLASHDATDTHKKIVIMFLFACCVYVSCDDNDYSTNFVSDKTSDEAVQ